MKVYIVTTDPESGDIPKELQSGIDSVVAVFSSEKNAKEYCQTQTKKYAIKFIYRSIQVDKDDSTES